MIPLCSSQYERQYNTVRIPGKDADTIVHYSDSHHLAVYHKGRWFKLMIVHNDQMLQPCEIQIQLDEIIRDASEPAYGEEHLAALTAGERTSWAETRAKYFSAGVNRTSLETIEKAAFILILDDEEYDIGSLNMNLSTPNNA
ncbi:unnamed protein product, partial [Adineta steineri]